MILGGNPGQSYLKAKYLLGNIVRNRLTTIFVSIKGNILINLADKVLY